MSGVAVIANKLVEHAPLTAIVPTVQIMSGELPEGTPTPCIGITQISSVPQLNVAMTGINMNQDRVQVTVLAKNYAQLRNVLRLVLAACPHWRGTVAGVNVDNILPQGEGPDFFDHETKIVGGSRDFAVRWTS